MRKAAVKRITNETNIAVALEIDGKGRYEVSAGIGFFEHMLALFAKQGLFDLRVKTSGDLRVDEHHTIEDVGIALGQAFKQALGGKRGIRRYGFFILPMDEVLALAAVDLSGRPHCSVNVRWVREKIGDFPTELTREFFKAFADNCGASVQLKLLAGDGREGNEHHKTEALFKAFGRALRMACERDPRIKGIPSTKGLL